MKRSRKYLVSFSGLDGSGKSTQIANLVAHVEAVGLRCRVLAFWDNVVVGSRWREGFVHKVYRSERGIGAPGRPVERRDKNIKRWYLTVARHALYFLDAVNLTIVVARQLRGDQDVLILDRYIYDQMANLPLGSAITRAYIRVVKAIVPQPDVAYLLDADPEAARERKPEYPVEFMRKSREAYHRLARMVGHITVIPPLELEDAKAEVLRQFAIRTATPAVRSPHPEAAAA